MKASTSSRRRTSNRAPKRRAVKRSNAKRKVGGRAVRAVIVGSTPAGIASATHIPDKREEELSDEESLDREERQELY